MLKLCSLAGIPVPHFKEYQSGFLVEFRKDIYTEEYLRKLGLNERRIKAVMSVKKRKVGRNDPCPCGSRKKFKKCCYGENIFNNHGNSKVPHSILPPHDMIDYGGPSINESFFQKNTLHEISAPRFLYTKRWMKSFALSRIIIWQHWRK